jgi:hypothetical protein
MAADHHSGVTEVELHGPTPKCPAILLSTLHVFEPVPVRFVMMEGSGVKSLLTCMSLVTVVELPPGP